MKNKIYKLLSIVLAVMLVFSCCTVAFNAIAEEEAEPIVYYIDSTGSDTEGDGTAEKPYLSVKEALKKATADGTNVAGQDVTIHAANDASNTSVDMWGTNSDADPYPKVYCNLTITADTALTRLHDADGGVSFAGTGTLTFNNIWFTVNSYSKIAFGNMNTTIGKGSKIQSGSYSGYVAIGDYNNNGLNTTTPYYITILGEMPTNSSNSYKNYGLFICDNQSRREFKNSIYITYDNADGAQEFVFGCGREDYEASTYYSKPINFNIKSAKAITFSSANVRSKGKGGYQFKDDGLIQVINSSGAALTGLDSIVTANKMASDFEQDDTPVTKWILTNKDTVFENAIDFTDTVGLYKVNEGYTVVATKVGDENVTVTSAVPEGETDAVLDLREYGAGEYTFTVEKQPDQCTVYVSAEGSDKNDGSSPETAVTTVAKAIEKAVAAGYTKCDTVTILVMGTEVNMGVLPTYKFDLVVDSYDQAAKTQITLESDGSTDCIANNENAKTTYKNVKVYKPGQYGAMYGVGSNMEFSSETELSHSYLDFIYGTYNDTTAHDSQKVVFNNTAPHTMSLSGRGGSSRTNNGDVTLVLNGGGKTSVKFTASYNGKDNGDTWYKKNVNILVKNASGLSLENYTRAYFQSEDGAADQWAGALQIIDSQGLDFNKAYGSKSLNTSISEIDADNKYIIHNNTGKKNLLDFTDVAGKYVVNGDPEVYTVKAVKGDEEVYESNGYLTLTTGEWTIELEKKSNLTASYYISAEGSDETGDGTQAKPFATLYQAVATANERGYADGDMVYIDILGSAEVKSYGSVVAHANDKLPSWRYTAYIRGNDPAVKAKLKLGGSTLGGTTIFDNLNITGGGDSARLGFNNVIFKENASYGTNYPVFGYYHSGTNNKALSSNGYTIELNGSQGNYSLNFGNNYGGVTHNGPVTVKINKLTNFATGFYFSDSNGRVVTFKDAVNLRVNHISTGTIVFRGATKNADTGELKKHFDFAEGSAFQFINNTGKNLGTDANTAPTLEAIPDNQKYILHNKVDNNLLDFTDTIGTFAISGIDESFYCVRATSVADSSVYFDSKDGLLTIEPGIYNITVEKRQNLKQTYYISAEGSDDNNGLTADKPFLTLKKAVDTAIEKGYGATDTITVKTIGSAAVASGNTGRLSFEPYAFKLVITANDTAVPGKIKDIVGFRGETEVTYITTTGQVAFNGFSVTFGKEAKIESSAGASIGHPNNVGISVNTTAPTNIKINKYSNAMLYFCGSYYNTATYNYPINLEIDNFAPYYNDVVYGGITFSTGGGVANTGKYYAPVNVKINSATSNVIPFKLSGSSTFGDNFAFQFINASDKPLGKTGDTLKRQDSQTGTLTSALDSMPEGKVYVLDNKTGNDDLVTFTDTVGTYKVADIDTDVYVVRATSVTDSSVYFDSKDGFLTVDAGEYKITLEKLTGKSFTYYVSANGSDETGNGTFEKPFATVAKAVEAPAAKGYGKGNTVTVKVIGNETVQWGTAAAYEFELAVVSNEAGNMSAVYIPNAMTGDVSFDDIKISLPTPAKDNPYNFLAGGYDVTFGANAKIDSQIITASKGATHSNPITHVYNNAFTYKYGSSANILLGNSVQNNNTFKNDVNYVVNNPVSEPIFGSMPYYGGTITYNANLNINIKDAASVAFTETTCSSRSDGCQAGSVTVKGAFQLIIPSDVALSEYTLTNIGNIIGDKYILKSNLGNVLDFTADGGKYTVADGYTVVALNGEGEQVAATVDGILDLSVIGAGEYTIVCTADIDVTVDDVDENNGYDIRDLVAVAMYLEDNSSVTLNTVAADKDGDGDVDADDLAIIRFELLTGETYTPDTQVATLSGIDAYDKKECLSPVAIKEQEEIEI